MSKYSEKLEEELLGARADRARLLQILSEILRSPALLYERELEEMVKKARDCDDLPREFPSFYRGLNEPQDFR